MVNQLFSPHEFWLLHAMLFVKRAELLDLEITSLKDVDELYLKYKNERGMKSLYGYEGSIDGKFDTDSLFDMMVNHLIETYPEKYDIANFKVWHTLTRKIYLEYKNYLTKEVINDTRYTIKGDYCACYYDFIGVENFAELKVLINEKGLGLEAVENSNIRFFRGYYYYDVSEDINQLLLKIDFISKQVEVFLAGSSSNLRDKYTGTIKPTVSSIAFELNSCEEGANGKLYFIMQIGHNPLLVLQNREVCFATYCSVVGSGKSSSGLLGFEAIPKSVNIDEYDGWKSEVPLHFRYLLSQNDITSQRDYKQTRIVWNRDIISLKKLKKQEKDELESYQGANNKLEALIGDYKCIFVNTETDVKAVSIASLTIKEEGEVRIKTWDATQQTIASYGGQIKTHDNIYQFSLKRVNQKVEILFEHRDYKSPDLYGVYAEIFRHTIIGGRILLIKLIPNKESNVLKEIKPRHIELYTREYEYFLKENPKFYPFFSGQLKDGYIDNSSLIKYRTKAEKKLPMPWSNTNINLLEFYQGTYQLFFLYKEYDPIYEVKSYIKSTPLSIDKDGYVSVKSIFSSNSNNYYQGRILIQKDKLFIFLYKGGWESYYGTMIWELGKQKFKVNNKNDFLQFIGIFNCADASEHMISSRIHIIKKSGDSGVFNSLESKLHPCYTRINKPFYISNSKIDLRKEFVGSNYNYIKLSQKANEDLNKKGKIRKENYANVFFKAAISSAQKGNDLKDTSIIQYGRELFKKALKHGWNEQELDKYDKEQFELYRTDFEDTIKTFYKKYHL